MYRFFLLFLFFIFVLPTISFACSCDLPWGTDEQQVLKAKKDTDAVFVGKLIELVEPDNSGDKVGGDVVATFKIERSWKKNDGDEITVFTTNMSRMCGFPFQKGIRYIVYASGKDTLYTNICTRTTPVGERSDDEQYLGKPIARKENK